MQFVQVHARPRRGYMDQVPSQPTSDMLTVLVVDDDRELRESLSAFLRHRGCSVKVAAGGVEGLQAGIPHAFAGVAPHNPPHTRETVLARTATPRPALRRRVSLCTVPEIP